MEGRDDELLRYPVGHALKHPERESRSRALSVVMLTAMASAECAKPLPATQSFQASRSARPQALTENVSSAVDQEAELAWVPFAPEPHTVLSFSDDRSLVLLGEGGVVRLWDAAKGLPRLALGRAMTAKFSALGKFIALGDFSEIRVVERTSGLAIGKPLATTDRLVTLLEEPLRVVTQGRDNKLRVIDVTAGTTLNEAPCSEVVAVSPNRRLAVIQGTFDTARVQLVELSSCREVARFQPAADDGVDVTHAAFSRDSQRAFVTLGNRDVNGQGSTTQLMQWRGNATFDQVARFEATSAEAIDFAELISNADGSTVTFANVEHFVPRSCVSCTYADRDSIGYTKSYEDFLVVDVGSGHMSTEWSSAESTELAPKAFFLPRRHEDASVKWSLWPPGFASPAPWQQRIATAFHASGNDRASLGVGPSAFALTRGRDAFIVDLATGQLSRVPPFERAEFASDGSAVLLQGQRDVELRRLRVADAPVLATAPHSTLKYGEVHLTADAKRFVVARGPQRIALGPTLAEQTLGVPNDCAIVTDDLAYCVTPLGDVYAVGAKQPLLKLGKLLEVSWDRKHNIGMALTAKRELVLVDLAHATARRLGTDTAAKPTCDATQPKDYACQSAFANYNQLHVLENFLSPKGDRWLAARRGSTFVGSVAQGQAERELGPIESFRWSRDGTLLDGFVASTWKRFDLVQGTEAQPGELKGGLPTPLVEVEGKLALLTDADRPTPLPNVPADDVKRVRGVMLDGRFVLLEAGDDYELLRSSDGARLRLAFPNEGGAVWIAGNGLPFDASELLLDRLSFVSKASPGSGRLASGHELAARCLDHDLLRKFVAGEPLRCKAK